MGMYTGLRCKCIVKEEFRPMIKSLMKDEVAGLLSWKIVADAYGYDFVKQYADYSRSSFIPFGSLAYMPDSWEADNKVTDGFERQFDEKTGYWAFQCSLKNYDDTIEAFFEMVLNNIAEKIIHLETYYEEDVYSERWDFVNGKIQCVDHQFIKYGFEDNYPEWYSF
jgi:hypothetical protein